MLVELLAYAIIVGLLATLVYCTRPHPPFGAQVGLGIRARARVRVGVSVGLLATLVYCTRPHPPFGAQDLVEEADYPALGALRGLGRVEPGELYVDSY